MAFETAQDRARAAGEMRRVHYRTLLDVAAAATGDKAYKQLRRELSGSESGKILVPKTEAEVVEMMRGKKDGV
jgi:hypothetical protein